MVGDKRGVTLLELLIVVAIIGVIAGISFPALTAGLAGVRLSSAAGSAASFLTSTMNTVERHEEPAALVISPKESRIAVFTAASGSNPANQMDLPPGITLDGDEARRLYLYPGGTFPRITIVLHNQKGGRRQVQIDPVTAVPRITR